MKRGIVLIFVLLLFISGCSQQDCDIENCHGLDISCGSNIPDSCTESYGLGDFCRQFAACEIIESECQLVEDQVFEDCKACVNECIGLEDPWECESNCRETF